MPQFVYDDCDPPVGPVVFAQAEDSTLTERMQVLFAADQAARQSGSRDWRQLARDDAERRRETMRYLAEGQLGAPESLYHAAMIFQHGNCPEHFDLAHQLAEHAARLGYAPARWLCAAALDRALMSRGQPQKYGTQYISYDNGPLELYQCDPSTTDEERARYDVPPLKGAPPKRSAD